MNKNTDLNLNKDGFIVQSWDIANSVNQNSDYSVCTIWQVHGDEYYLIDLYRVKLLYPDLKKLAYELHKKYGGVILIEDCANGTALASEMKHDPEFKGTVIPRKPTISKKQRFMDVIFYFQKGSVLLPKNTSWYQDLRDELYSFPMTKHDDQVDSVVQFLNWIREINLK
jgi:predicted phage terminase large subunit-like protein